MLYFLPLAKNAPGGIRTSDLRFRKPTLYPTELRALHSDNRTIIRRVHNCQRSSHEGLSALFAAGVLAQSRFDRRCAANILSLYLTVITHLLTTTYNTNVRLKYTKVVIGCYRLA